MEENDEHFTAVLNNVADLPSFVDSYFHFLYRKTNFFKVKTFQNISEGYPPGVAEVMVRDTFRKYQKLASENDISDIPVEENIEIETSETTDNFNLEHLKNSVCEDLDQEDPKLKAQQKKFQTDSDSYNGANRDNYCWSQSILDVDIKIKVAKDIVKGKQVKVNVGFSHLKVCILIDGKWVDTVDDDLSFKVDKENAVWSLIPGEYIHVSLEKQEERWWESLLKNEPKIDLKHINCERPVEDLPEEEQAKIEELMFDERQKKQGKPTIQQLKMEDLLREAWDKDGSPFKGQPFDPTLVNVHSSQGSLPI